MSADWQPGDLAMLVRAGVIPCACGGIRNHLGLVSGGTGSIGTVAAISTVGELNHALSLCTCPVLLLDGGKSGVAARFRKIHPLSPEEHRQALTDLDVPVVEVVS